ncbi:MAG: AIR synthase family protein [Lachnospiraceae bacterium]|nr:AIR synthase family protein [Lachnospiraceae bacterium]
MTLDNGKISENILKRSVIKRIKTRRDDIISSACPGGDFAAIDIKDDTSLVMTTDTVTGDIKDIGIFAVNKAVNNIAVSGALVIGIMLAMILPEGSDEGDIKKIMSQADLLCKELNVDIIGGHTEVSGSVKEPVITVTGIGSVKKNRLLGKKRTVPGDDVVITKWIGIEGTVIMVNEREDELLKRFSAPFIDTARGFSGFLSVLKDAEAVKDLEVHSMHDASTGGIFSALWETAGAAGCGIRVDLKSIPVKQETIEISEYFGISPYEMLSGGAMVITCANGTDVVRALGENGINAAIVGKITDDNDRIVFNGEEKRFLEPPRGDEIYKVIKREI